MSILPAIGLRGLVAYNNYVDDAEPHSGRRYEAYEEEKKILSRLFNGIGIG
jgi:hypothetical protein